MTHPLFPVKLITTHIPTDGTNPVQSVEKTFQLTRATKDLLLKQDFEIQAWCMLLNDKVPFRMQWPQSADLLVNGYSVRAINRPGSQLLDDDGPIITPYTKEGVNKICLTGCDTRIFCLGVRIIRKHTVQQVLNLIPKESDGERFEAALARVCCHVGGGNSANEADSDSDLVEVVSDTFSINLRCPMYGSRMKIAGRFKPCVHMVCFDLEVFVEMNQRSRNWQCPICLKNYALEDIIIDPYFNRITSMMKNCGEEFTEVEVKPDGYWRVKAKNESECRELGNLAKWHSPDGFLSVSTSGEDKRAETLNIKQEGVSDSPNGLRLGIRKNRTGVWEASKPIETNTSSDNRLNANLGNHELVVIQMSSSGTGSGLDGDDPSVNQSGGGHIDYSATNGIEADSVWHTNVNSTYGYPMADADTIPNTSTPMADADTIVLSDSKDDDILVSPTVGCNNNQTGDAVDVYSAPPPGITDPYGGDPNIDRNSCLGVYDNPDVCFGVPSLWPLRSRTQASSGFQLFSSDVDVSDALAHGDINCSSSLNSYKLAPDTALGSNTLTPNSSTDQSDTDLNGGLVNNPLAFGGNDPSLQIFLPTRPAESSVQHELRDCTDVLNGVCTEDWVSLSLGGGAGGSNGDASTPNGLNSGPQITSRKDATHSLTDTELASSMTVSVDWSELPTDLLNKISQRIDNEIDLIRFRSICSNWRSSSIRDHHTKILPFKFPFLRWVPFVNPDSKNRFEGPIDTNVEDYPFSRHLSKCSTFLIKPPQQQQEQQDQTLRPWLIRILQHPNGKIKVFRDTEWVDSFFPFFEYSRVLDFNDLSVIQLGENSYINEEDVTPPPDFGESVNVDPDVVYAITCNGKTPLLLGSFSYVVAYPMVLGYLDESWWVIGPTTLHGDTCVFKGRFCALNLSHTTLVEPESSLQLMAQPEKTMRSVTQPILDATRKLLVESDGQLLLVNINESFPDYFHIDLFQLDEKENKWVRLRRFSDEEKKWVDSNDLGDRILFIGHGSSFSAHASELGLPKGNSVVFMDDSIIHKDNFRLRYCLYDLDEDELCDMDDYPEYSNLFLPPTWILNR
ncbi:E3 SUMO-protein ligase SIZ1-like isoform X2 [Trifolium pratense]|nr:E3 SUMO-protein ligase SIZ1-like isoform X2 [Trifolium pratense]